MKTAMSSTRQKKVVLNNDLKLFSIIVWLLYRGSIPLYDYSYGVEGSTSIIYLCLNLLKNLLYYTNNVVDLVYNGS